MTASTSAMAGWQPTSVKRVIRVLATSTRPIECVLDDDVRAFVKVLGNPEGPSALVCELVGTEVARSLGIPVFDVAIPEYPAELCTQLEHGLLPQRGPCFATRAATGISWDGRGESLDALDNPEQVAGLVVLDTWLRNPDRFFVRRGTVRKNLRNVFLREDGVPRGSFRLHAIDHTHAMRQDGALARQSLHIDRERESLVYGLFPEFTQRIERDDPAPFTERLRHLARTTEIDEIVRRVPKQWFPDGDVRQDLPGFLKRRALHVAENVDNWLASECQWLPSPASAS